MSESRTASGVMLPLELQHQVDNLCDAFKDELVDGATPDVDAYLAQVPTKAHRQMLREMAQLVLVHRREQKADHAAEATERSPLERGEADDVAKVGDSTKAFLRRSLELLPQLDEAEGRFEAALERNEPVRIEDMLAAVDAEVRPRLLRELLTLEMAFRARKGESPSLADYRERFLDDARLVKYLYLEHFLPPRIGEFTIQKLVGRGGFGHVYQGWDSKLSRNVAIKVFRRDPSERSHWREGLLFEARAAAQLRHPGIVAVYAVLPDQDNDEFLVLEYVDGRSLEDLLRSRRLASHEAVELLLAVTQALQHSHERGLVHRDLKPANILLDQGNRPRVTDFGLALHMADLRRSPDVVGTLPYMAPEQANGETHRVDARTDLWAIGVTLYRALSGWLPFSGANKGELLEAIRKQEPKDLLQHDPTISAELARIVRRCMAKQMSERYQSATDLAADLKALLNPVDAPNRLAHRPAGPQRESTAPSVVPKGLRCFDQGDREFFLRLVPGPRDRRGIPEGVRFWEQRLQEREPTKTFRVGLLYGPSGCGKSSLVRAGILPLLHPNVRTVVIEATRDETERRLLTELRRQFSGLPPGLSLPEAMAELREGGYLPAGEKLVIVLDQFEQWLHGWSQDEDSVVIDALRQCDGGLLQALVLVRDDFWMPATRLFKRLDIPLAEGINASAVDLFDQAHATQVLCDFGVAYGRLPADAQKRSAEHKLFLERAVSGLSDDGWIVPVRLCIFAEMLKSRPWTPATLREVGGTEGLGAAFLESVFESRSASPMHRLHHKAARAVLERLLPASGSEIRGHLVAESELRAASGYADDKEGFANLIHCLDQELRLITPSDAETAPSTGGTERSRYEQPRLYQLTHDFLVMAIRNWLNQSRRRTVKGRAELRLAEYAAAYAANPEPRQLPSWWEWLTISTLTRRSHWRDAEQTMMQAATRRYTRRAAVVAAAVILLSILVYDRIAATRAEGLVQALTTSDSRDVPRSAENLVGYEHWARPRLIERLEDSAPGSDERTRVLLGLLAVGEPASDELWDRLLDAEPQLSAGIADVLQAHGGLEKLEPKLRAAAMDQQGDRGRRLRALVALGRLPPAAKPQFWDAFSGDAAMLLLKEIAQNPRLFDAWVAGLAPASRSLVDPLAALCNAPRATQQEQLLAAEVLARYAAGDPLRLLDQALAASPTQLDVFAKPLLQRRLTIEPVLAAEADRAVPSDASEDEKDRLSLRQANAVLLLEKLGNDNALWRDLDYRPDPRARSFLLDYLRSHPPLGSWQQRIAQQEHPGVRQALVLVLADAVRQGSNVVPAAELRKALGHVFRDDADPGVHGAAEWALRALGEEEQLARVLGELSQIGLRPGFGWYVTKSKITMTIVPPRGNVTLGSPRNEPGRDESDEAQWTCHLDWTFAISTHEITQRQYIALCPEYQHRENENAPHLDCPVNRVTWTEAQQYCRKLSEQDGIPEAEMAIPPAGEARKTAYEDCVSRTGYRLPIEAEWELACRAGTETSRYYGHAPQLLGTYACYFDNSGGMAWRVGTGWPNAFGLFDTLGNASEWCQNLFAIRQDPLGTLKFGGPSLLFAPRIAVRGNEHGSNASAVRAANRRFAAANDVSSNTRGFRIAHTIRVEGDKK